MIVDRTSKVLEDFIEFLKENIHHGEVIEIPQNSFLVVRVSTTDDEAINKIAKTFTDISTKLPQPFEIVILPNDDSIKLQVYEGTVYVGVRDKKFERHSSHESL